MNLKKIKDSKEYSKPSQLAKDKSFIKVAELIKKDEKNEFLLNDWSNYDADFLGEALGLAGKIKDNFSYDVKSLKKQLEDLDIAVKESRNQLFFDLGSNHYKALESDGELVLVENPDRMGEGVDYFNEEVYEKILKR